MDVSNGVEGCFREFQGVSRTLQDRFKEYQGVLGELRGFREVCGSFKGLVVYDSQGDSETLKSR